MTSKGPLLMIPGPTEFHSEVYDALAAPTRGHLDPEFIETFSHLLKSLRSVVVAGDSVQPIVLAGGGSIGWDVVAANFTEPGDNVVVVNTGYFGHRFAECLKSYGAEIHVLGGGAQVTCPSAKDLEHCLSSLKSVKMVTITQVDTSTGVLAPVAEYAAVIRRCSPNSLIVVDGVCATGAEITRFDAWDLDVVLTGSQKALGAPPGLALLWASSRAIRCFETRKTPVVGYYVNLKGWLPILKAYEEKKPSYYSTPPVNMICAMDTAVRLLLNYGLNQHEEIHLARSLKFRNALRAIGLSTLAGDERIEAHTMTAVKLPAGVDQGKLIGKIREHNVVVTGGLLAEIKTTYFRVGHMGISVRDPSRGDLETTMTAICAALNECGYACDVRVALAELR